jgi:cyclophilin family peptidyl-prolyl cis-trans isomerase
VTSDDLKPFTPFYRLAPRANPAELARTGYYNGTIFHRVIRDFMVRAKNEARSHAAKITPNSVLGCRSKAATQRALEEAASLFTAGSSKMK